MSLQQNQTALEQIYFTPEEISTASFNAIIDDHILKTSVFRSLKWYSSLPLDQVTITVYHGYVILNGVVPWAYQKVVTSKMVQSVKGLKGIINNIRVVSDLAA